MIKKISLSILLATSLFSSTVFAQTDSAIDWEKQPHIHKIPDSLNKNSAVYILDKRHYKYKEESGGLYVYRTFHRVIKLLDDKGIESFNKLSIPISDGRSIERLDARTILPNGKVRLVSKDQIQTTKDEEGRKQYLIAMEGVEKNAEVELLYTERRPFASFGGEIFQSTIPVLSSEFTLISPSAYRFEFKSYNGFPDVKDTIIGSHNLYTASIKNIPALEDEDYANYYANLMDVDFKLSYADKAAVGVKLYTWSELVKNLYSRYYDFSGKEKKVVLKYLETIGVSEKDKEEERIEKIEDYLKSNITISGEIDNEDGEYSKLDVIIDKKLTTESGFTKLLCACLYMAGVDFQLGITSDYTYKPVNTDFEYWGNLDYYVIYFPKRKKFLSPPATFLRYPMVPVSNLNNKGIFVKLTTLGNITSAVHAVHTIKPLDARESTNDINATVTFAGEDLTPVVDFQHSFSGYTAYGLREASVYVPKEKEKAFAQSLIVVADKEEDVQEYKIKNKAFKNYSDDKPLTITAKATAPSLLEKAGNKYLFNIGDILGKQSEMYNDEKRKMDIEIPYPHSLKRKIVVNIPAGYTVQNPEAVNSNVVQKGNDGSSNIWFKSSYTMDGGKMIVDIDEYYGSTHYPLSEYPIFRKVINAAADFNKVVLVFEKK